MLAFALCLTLLLFAAWILWARRPVSRGAQTLPPGPKPIPLMGNIFDMPTSCEWETFSRWGQIYGELVYVTIFGRRMVILNTAEVANDLLEKRSAIYSDRPNFPLVDLAGHSTFNFGFMPYGKRWQLCRHLFASQFGRTTANVVESCQFAASSLLQNLLRDPGDLVNHLRLHSGQLILDATYGIPISSREDKFIKTAEKVMGTISIAVSPAMWIINPVLLCKSSLVLRDVSLLNDLAQYLPGWLGGNYLIRKGHQWRADVHDLRTDPFEQTKASMAAGTAKASFITNLLEQSESIDGPGLEREEMIKDCAAVAFGGTSLFSPSTFFLALMANPHVQTKAQEEIDRIVGPDRLPMLVDRPRLPYVTAVLKETLRWHPPAPQGIPHLLTTDDHYKGYTIPAGTMVIGNIWGILHDPAVYRRPLDFNPDRYLPSGILDVSTNDPSRVAFGFGRRVCPGKVLAEDALWLTMAQILSVYTIRSPPGIEFVKPQFTSGAISHPLPFLCDITPRSEAAEALIHNLVL
ncbi:cytochrome P450 [Amylostereum chailletii]|nr:cytochrome P450 [Amylostereum chailletii]